MYEFLLIIALGGLAWVSNLAYITIRYYNTPKDKREKYEQAFNLAWGRE